MVAVWDLKSISLATPASGNTVLFGALAGQSDASPVPFDIDTLDTYFAQTSKTLTNKTLTAPDINGGTADSLTSLSIRSTGAAFDVLFASAEAISANRTLSWVLGNAARTITLSGNPTLSDWFDQSVKVAASPQFAAIELGHASANTLTASSGILSIEGEPLSRAVDLASTANAKGASLIGIEDSGSYFSQTNVETALAYLGAAVAALDQAVILKGTWDASAGTFPGSGSAQSGWSYIVSVSGTVDSVAFTVGDRIIAITDNASASTYASNWFKADYTDLVSSVAGRTGAVTLAQADISGLTTASSPQFAAINVGDAADTTITRVSSGVIAVEGSNVLLASGLGSITQAYDADLAAIAALTTTAAGRSVLTIADPGADRLVFWDDSADTMKAMALADMTTEAAPATGDYLVLYGAEGDVRKVNWSSLPAAGSTGSIFYVESYGAVGDNSTDNTTAIQAAITAASSAGGGIVLFGPGIFRVSSQLTIDSSGITIMGIGGGNNAAGGTTLDLRASAHKFLIGNGSTQRQGIRFTGLRFTDSAATSHFLFETRIVRGIAWDHCTFTGIYGFVQLGRSGEDSSFIFFGDQIEGNFASTHSHFASFIAVSGAVFCAGSAHIEGAATPISGASFFHVPTTVRPDGVQIGGSWCVRQFGRGVNFRGGCANVHINNVIFDEVLSYGVYADTDSGAINGLTINGCHFVADDTATSSIAVAVFKTTETAQSVSIIGNRILEIGDEGIWVTGDMDSVIMGNRLRDVGARTDNTFAAIRLGTASRGVCASNYVNNGVGNNHKYGVNNQSTATIDVRGNVSENHGTAEITGFCREMSFSAHKNGSDQTGITSAVATKLTFGTEVWDVGDGFDNATNYRWTPGPGIILFDASAYTSANVVNGSSYWLMLYKNGSNLRQGHVLSAAGTNSISTILSCIDASDNDDYYEIYYQGEGAGNKTVNGTASVTYFQGKKI